MLGNICKGLRKKEDKKEPGKSFDDPGFLHVVK